MPSSRRRVAVVALVALAALALPTIQPAQGSPACGGIYMRKKLSVVVAAALLSAAVLPGVASAGQYCEAANGAGAGTACREVGAVVLKVCTKVEADCTVD